MKPATLDVEARKPVWEALSTLFLDTDVSLDREYRAAKLAESPYTLGELDQILHDEVFPVCSWNWFLIAGEWAGFDSEALARAILRRLGRRFRFRVGFGHHLIVRSREWKRTKALIEAKRLFGGGAGCRRDLTDGE
ncbi:MAG: hypothetical protein ACLQBD_10195 [Syntrophobacteraceae bacterium]